MSRGREPWSGRSTGTLLRSWRQGSPPSLAAPPSAMRVGARTVLVERRVEVKDVPKFVAGEAVLAHVTDPITRIRLSTRTSTARAHPLPDPIYVTPATCRSPPLNSTAGASHSRVTLAAGGAEMASLGAAVLALVNSSSHQDPSP